MVGHQHAVVADIFVNANSFDEIYIPIVGEGLLKIEKAASDVAEVNVEDLFATAEVADHVEDLGAGVLQHLRDCSLAEIQSVVWTGFDFDEALQSVHTAEHAVYATKALR